MQKSQEQITSLPAARKTCETLQWTCDSCQHSTTFQTSIRGLKGTSSIPAYESNIRSVYGSQTSGRAGLSEMCSILNLPQPVRWTPYNNIQNKLSEVSVEHANQAMKEAGQRLFSYMLEKEPDNSEITADGKIIVNAAVTVDGTWQKRGHTSKNGAVFFLSVETGEVLENLCFATIVPSLKKSLVMLTLINGI